MTNKTILVLAMVATFIAGASAISILDNTASASKPVPYVVRTTVDIPVSGIDGGLASCNPGDTTTGGGFTISPSSDIQILSNAPAVLRGEISPYGWGITAQNNGVVLDRVTTWVVCVP
jgi:hypothetical protein